MKTLFASKRVERQCTDMKTADRLFGGNKAMTRSLFARLNALASAEIIKDIIVQPQFRFHKLSREFEGYFTIDVKSKTDPWRIILQPLDNTEKPFVPCNIDEIATTVKIISIKEVSKHYE